MASIPVPIESLSVEERIELMGRLWDSLDPDVAAPITPAIAAELDQAEVEDDADPTEGVSWDDLRRELRDKLR